VSLDEWWVKLLNIIARKAIELGRHRIARPESDPPECGSFDPAGV
jgi:hypothetical protein